MHNGSVGQFLQTPNSVQNTEEKGRNHTVPIRAVRIQKKGTVDSGMAQ